ncbi:MAG: Arc family DNA-binding protein [Pseudomonadales bacterium]|nr:Arc family DNA-binding protein [Pseudomonadales bacterium]
MASITIRNVPDTVHRAIRLRAAKHGRSTEAEIRAILEQAAQPQGSVKLGSLLAEIGRKVRLTDEEFAIFESASDTSTARAVNFE